MQAPKKKLTYFIEVPRKVSFSSHFIFISGANGCKEVICTIS